MGCSTIGSASMVPPKNNEEIHMASKESIERDIRLLFETLNDAMIRIEQLEEKVND